MPGISRESSFRLSRRPTHVGGPCRAPEGGRRIFRQHDQLVARPCAAAGGAGDPDARFHRSRSRARSSRSRASINPQFLAIGIHELRTPLMRSSASELILDQLTATCPNGCALCSSGVHTGQRQHLFGADHDVLDRSKIEAGQPKLSLEVIRSGPSSQRLHGGRAVGEEKKLSLKSSCPTPPGRPWRRAQAPQVVAQPRRTPSKFTDFQAKW